MISPPRIEPNTNFCDLGRLQDSHLLTIKEVEYLCHNNPYYDVGSREKLNEIYKKILGCNENFDEQQSLFLQHLNQIIEKNPEYSNFLMINLKSNIAMMDSQHSNNKKQIINSLGASAILGTAMAISNIFLQNESDETKSINNSVLGICSALPVINAIRLFCQNNEKQHQRITEFFGKLNTYSPPRGLVDLSEYDRQHVEYLFRVENNLVVENRESQSDNPDGILFGLEKVGDNLTRTIGNKAKYRIKIITLTDFDGLSEDDQAKLIYPQNSIFREDIDTVEKFREMIRSYDLSFKDGKTAESVFNEANKMTLQKDFFNTILQSLEDSRHIKVNFMTIQDSIKFHSIIDGTKISELLQCFGLKTQATPSDMREVRALSRDDQVASGVGILPAGSPQLNSVRASAHLVYREQRFQV